MSNQKKVLLGAAAGIGAVVLALVLLPLLFVDEIEARVRTEIERISGLRVTWADAGVSVLRDFPNPALSLRGVTAVGTGRFDGDTLATVGDFRLAVNYASVLRAVRGTGSLEIRSVLVERPDLRLQVDEDGTASWDVFPEAEPTSREARTEGGATLSLRAFEVVDGSVALDDAQSGLAASVRGLHQSLSGDFSRSRAEARTRVVAEAVSLRFAGIDYLSGTSFDFDAGLEVDLDQPQVRLIDNRLLLNELDLRMAGVASREGDDIGLDLTFEAPRADFDQILSLVPLVYSADFASLETSGRFTLNGRIQGAYGETAFPGFELDLAVTDGRFRYPDLALPVEAIAAALTISNPGGDLDSTVVELSTLHLEVDGQPLDVALTLRTPVSDPAVDLRAEGTLDLADVARTVKVERADELAGVLVVDASVGARRSDVDSARYDRISARGAISARGVALRSDALRQPVDIEDARLELSPRAAELHTFRARLGSSDVQATGRLDNLLGFAIGEQPLTGAASMTSTRLVLDEWRSDDEVAAIPVPAMLDLTIDGRVDTIVLNGLEMTNARGRAIVRDQRVTLEGVGLEAFGGRIGLDGTYETTVPSRPTFALDVVLDSLDMARTAAALPSVRTLAPVARYTRGTFSSALDVQGALGQDLTVALDVLEGEGSLSTSQTAVEGFPLFDRLGETLQLQRLANPTVDAVRSSIRIRGGRLFVDPFPVRAGGLAMTVSGSNGIDQSIDYTVRLEVPRAGFAEGALTSLASRAGPLGQRLAAADPVPVSVRARGFVSQPEFDVSLDEATGAARAAVDAAARAAVEERIDEAQQRLDSAETAARTRARARADSVVAAAERQAETIRSEAARAATEVRAGGERAAEALLARAGNPLARAAAQPAADRLRREAEERATALEREADERATALVAEARERADAIIGGRPAG